MGRDASPSPRGQRICSPATLPLMLSSIPIAVALLCFAHFHPSFPVSENSVLEFSHRTRTPDTNQATSSEPVDARQLASDTPRPRPPMFKDVSHLISGNSAELRYGVCAADLDGDKRSEFFVCGFGNRNLVLKWKNGKLENIAVAAYAQLADPDRHAIGVAAGDADQDGEEEVYVLNTDTFMGAKRFGDRLFDLSRPANGDASWTDLFTSPQNVDAANRCAGRSVCALDRKGSGAYGFFVANYGCPMRLYELSRGTGKGASQDGKAVEGEGGVIVDSAKAAGLALPPTGGRACLPGPLISGSATDIFVGNENGPNFLLVNRGDGRYEEVAAKYGVADPYENARGVALVDVEGSGQLGLAVGNWEGAHRLYAHTQPKIASSAENGTAASSTSPFVDRATAGFASPSRIRTVIAADFDNDGLEEVFLNNIGEPNRLFCQGPVGTWIKCDIGDAIESDGFGTGASIADVDGDGFLELLVSHGESVAQPLSLFKVEGNGNSWLRVRPLTAFGAPARGAVVQVTGSGVRRQRKVVDGGSGYLCCMEPVAHFGLGKVPPGSRVEVKVTWPDGKSRTLPEVQSAQELEVAYPSADD